MSSAHETKVFISHSKHETALAVELKKALEEQGLTAWAYEEDLRFGRQIETEIRRSIELCDHFLIILSPSAQKSEWVGRELGLALKRQRDTGGRPSIIGVCGWSYPVTSSDPAPTSIVPRDFATGAPAEPPHDFGSIRYFDWSVDSIRTLVNRLSLRVEFIDPFNESQRELLEASFDCYERLFPDDEERDTREDILVWLHEGRGGELGGSPWREVYATLHTADQTIGMAFLTMHVVRHWCFGNYFGVVPGWRQDRRAEVFLNALQERIAEIDPECRGILLETQAVNGALLSSAEKLAAASHTAVRENLRRLSRLFLYTRRGAKALVDAHGSPVPYWQPALEEPLDASNEVPLVLMALLREENVALRDILDFIYDDFYGDAYGGDGVVDIPGFREYTKTIKSRVLKAAESQGHFAAVKFPPLWRKLWFEARTEFPGSLAL